MSDWADPRRNSWLEGRAMVSLGDTELAKKRLQQEVSLEQKLKNRPEKHVLENLNILKSEETTNFHMAAVNLDTKIASRPSQEEVERKLNIQIRLSNPEKLT